MRTTLVFLNVVTLLCVIMPHSALFAQTATVSGIVSEATSGESVIGINVVLMREINGVPEAKPFRGARTNKFGFYSIANVPAGSYTLVVRGVGYKAISRPFVMGEGNVRENIALALTDVRTQEISVEADRIASPTRNISSVALSMDFINKMPSFGGEKDIFRVLQLLPGVKTASELSSGLYVRGGSPDQNLNLLDGVIIYNPSHLGGFLSTFNGDAIRDVRLIKGAFPAEYGGRLSSVIDLTMKEGTKEKISGTGNVSLIASRLTVEGPITEDVTFMVSGRRTYFDLLVGLATINSTEKPPQYYFYDLNGKINWKLSDNDRIYLSGYFGRDVLQNSPTAGSTGTSGTAFGLDWGNASGNLRWMHVVSPSLFTNFSVIYTDYNFSTGIGSGDSSTTNFNSFSQIRDFMLRGDAQWFPAQDHTVKIGAEATFHNFRTLVSSDNSSIQDLIRRATLGTTGDVTSLEGALYAQDEWQNALGATGLSVNAGLRMAYFQKGNRLLPEPRLSASYALTDDISLKGAFAVANQFLHLVVRNDLTLPSDTWFPSTETVQPSNSTQYVLGMETSLFDKEVLFSVEGYYKTMKNLYEFRDDAKFSLFAPLESDLTRGTGEAYGVEVFLHKRVGAFTGWLGYTLSWTTRQFDDLNNGKPFYPRYDSRHDISATFTYKLGESWEFGASWVYNTGQAYTMPSGRYYWNPINPYQPQVSQTSQQNVVGNVSLRSYQQYTERNGFRLPPFHKLDLNFTHYFSWFGLPFNFSINVYNAYNRRNPFAWVLERNSSAVPQLVQYTLFPIIPTFGLGFKF